MSGEEMQSIERDAKETVKKAIIAYSQPERKVYMARKLEKEARLFLENFLDGVA